MGNLKNIVIVRFFLAVFMAFFQIFLFVALVVILLLTLVSGGNWRRAIAQTFTKSTYWYVLETHHKEYEFGSHAKKSLLWRNVLVYKSPLAVLHQKPQLDYIHEYRKTRFDIY